MKVFVYCGENGQQVDYDNFSAQWGFNEMGFEIISFHDYNDLVQNHQPEDIIICGIGMVKRRLYDLGLEMPDIDYPDSLSEYYGRRIWRSKINTVNSSPEMWSVFVKPVSNKRFIGRVINSTKDLIGCGSCYDDADIYCSEPVRFVSEYRCFVRYGKIIDVRKYKGDWKISPDPKVIEQCVNSYNDSPKGYALDFGVTDDNRTLLIEVNATVCIGSYGLDSIFYAKLLSARWAELTGTTDECAFDL